MATYLISFFLFFPPLLSHSVIYSPTFLINHFSSFSFPISPFPPSVTHFTDYSLFPLFFYIIFLNSVYAFSYKLYISLISYFSCLSFLIPYQFSFLLSFSLYFSILNPFPRSPLFPLSPKYYLFFRLLHFLPPILLPPH